MNKQNFEEQDRFPLSTQALTFMQDMIMASAQLSLIGGKNYILSGCETTGGNVNPGVIVVNGEIMPFEGGVKVDTITIVENMESVSANAMTFDKVRVKRYAIFARGNGSNYYAWSDFAPLPTNQQLEKAKATVKYVDDEIAKLGGVPYGVIVMWSGSVTDIPKGWQLCNGGPIGNTGKYTPNLSGRFIVGYSAEESLGYKTLNKGSKNPDQYNLTLRPENIPAHVHDFKDYFFSEGPWNNHGADGSDPVRSDMIGSASTDNKNGYLFYKIHKTESFGAGQGIDIRPPYYVLAFIIKVN